MATTISTAARARTISSSTPRSAPGNADIVAGFVSGTDKFVLDDAIFDGLGLGALPASVFHVGPAATDEDQRIIYDSTTGSLYYDADGSGGGAAILFAVVSPGTTIIASDFIVS